MAWALPEGREASRLSLPNPPGWGYRSGFARAVSHPSTAISTVRPCVERPRPLLQSPRS
jgi:hypothetical protein